MNYPALRQLRSSAKLAADSSYFENLKVKMLKEKGE